MQKMIDNHYVFSIMLAKDAEEQTTIQYSRIRCITPYIS